MLNNIMLRLRRSEAGVALLEFALILPVLLLLLVGSIELARFFLANQKLDNATSTIADLITRTNSDAMPCGSGNGELGWYRTVVLPGIMAPYTFASSGHMVVSSIEAHYSDPSHPDDAVPMEQKVVWQWKDGGASKFGAENAVVSGEWPAAFRASPDANGLRDGDRVIAVETFYQYDPLIPGIDILNAGGQPIEMYKAAFYRARFSNLSSKGCSS